MTQDTADIAFADEADQVAKKPEQDAVPATAEDFLGKKRKTMKVAVRFTEEGPAKVITLVAIPRTELDEMQAAHPATPKQARLGASVNPDTYPPALLAAVVTVPSMTLEQWTEVWKSKEWSQGEHTSLFRAVENFCTELLDLSPFDSD